MRHLLDRLVPRAYPIGIDLGASGAKLVQLGCGSSGLRVIGMLRLEAPEIVSGETENERIDAMVRGIARRVAGGGFRGRQCVLSVDDRMLRTRSIRQPRMPDVEIDAAIRLDGAQRLGFGEEEASEIGWMRAGEVHQGDEVRDELIYLGAPSEPLARIAMGLASCGLRPLAIEPGFVALTRCFARTLRRSSDGSVVRVLVDVGYGSTGVVLARGSGVAFYKPLELGGEDLVRVAAERLGLEPQTVNDLRRQRIASVGAPGTGIDPKVDRALYDAVRPLLGDLAHEVNLCVRHYCVTFRGSRPSECLVVGGEAREPRLTEAIQDALQIDTSVGRPLAGIEGVRRGVAPVDEGACPEWAVGVGLSLRAAEARSESARGARRERLEGVGEEAGLEEVRRAA